MKVKYYEDDIMEGQGLIGDLFGKVIDKTQRYSGERHTALMTSKGPKIATYTGPNTQITKRLQSSDPKIRDPLGPVDTASQAHDIRYTLSTSVNDIREADNKMIRKLKEIEMKNEDYKVNTAVVRGLMKTKTLYEDARGKRGELFSGLKPGQVKPNTLSPSEESLYKKKLTELEMLGYGQQIEQINPRNRILKDIRIRTRN